jgi:hypothetical protein
MAYWDLRFAGTKYTIHVTDSVVNLAMDTGNKETSGFNTVPAARFLRSKGLQQHVRETFGDQVLREVLSAVREAASLDVGSD